MKAVHVLIAIGTENKWPILQIDVKMLSCMVIVRSHLCESASWVYPYSRSCFSSQEIFLRFKASPRAWYEKFRKMICTQVSESKYDYFASLVEVRKAYYSLVIH